MLSKEGTRRDLGTRRMCRPLLGAGAVIILQTLTVAVTVLRCTGGSQTKAVPFSCMLLRGADNPSRGFLGTYRNWVPHMAGIVTKGERKEKNKKEAECQKPGLEPIASAWLGEGRYQIFAE